MDIVIEKNVPMPEGNGRGAPTKYPFAEMKVGDSFAVPLSGERVRHGRQKGSIDKSTAQVNQAATYAAKRHGHKYTVRTDSKAGVVRCWRIA